MQWVQVQFYRVVFEKAWLKFEIVPSDFVTLSMHWISGRNLKDRYHQTPADQTKQTKSDTSNNPVEEGFVLWFENMISLRFL